MVCGEAVVYRRRLPRPAKRSDLCVAKWSPMLCRAAVTTGVNLAAGWSVLEPLTKLRVRILSFLTSAGYHSLRRAPVVGPVMLRAFDLALSGRRSIKTSVLRGPLTGMVLEFDPRVQADVIVGRYEQGVQDIIVRELSDGDTAFDIGSHFGYLGLVMAMRVGSAGNVVCFEPDPDVLDGLIGNVERNSSRIAASVTVVGSAVGARPGRQFFARGSQTSRGKLSDAGELEVEVITLDQAGERYGMPRLIKIDVEGRELDVLEGGAGLLQRASPVLVIEAHDERLATGCTHLLERFGYTCQEMREAGRAETYLVARSDR